MLYDKHSAAEIGTMYAAKNFLNAVNVPLVPMDDVDASFEFLKQYTEGLILAATKNVIVNTGLTNFSESKELMEAIIDQVMEKFVKPGLTWNLDLEEGNLFKCNFCNKQFKRLNTLRKHQQKLHANIVDNPDVGNDQLECHLCHKVYKIHSNLKKHIEKMHTYEFYKSTNLKSDEKEDSLQRYTSVGLTLGLLALNFNDARKVGDGERLMRLYKLIMLLYRIDGRTKYAYYTYQMLCQIYYLLPDHMSHDLVYNRFVNNAGKEDSNVEIDREVEHWNKKFKKDCKEFNGKVTSKSIERASNAYQSVDFVLKNFDKCAGIKSSSGAHTKANVEDDTKKLGKQFIANDIFSCVPGRRHSSFPRYPKNIFQLINVPDLKQWMLSKLERFKELNIYRSLMNE